MRINRRQFLGSSAAVLGLGESKSPKSQPPVEPARIRAYRTLGRTGYAVSDLAAGTGLSAFDPSILSTVLDRGVNYIDTGEGYGNGQAETTIGEVIKKRDRKSLFITTKLTLTLGSGKESLLRRAREALERLQTDYVDCLMLHDAQNVEQLSAPGFHDAMAVLKKEGRVRHVGVACHGSYGMAPLEDSMENILLAAAEDGRFDVMLLVYNFLARERGEVVLQACSEKNIGTTLMKTNPVADFRELKNRVEEERRGGREATEWMRKTLGSFEQQARQADDFMRRHRLKSLEEVGPAALRYVLSNETVHSVCLSFHNFDLVESYLGVSGTRLDTADSALLSEYARDCSPFYCRHACGLCQSRCPYGVPVNTIMRYNHYFAVQRREKIAMEMYRDLTTSKADFCGSCEGYCAEACPYGVAIQPLLVLADRRLTLA